MAGNKNPWRDIVSPAEWQQIKMGAAQQNRAWVNGQRRVAPAPPAAPQAPGTFVRATVRQRSPADILTHLEAQIVAYDIIEKDDSTRFAQRARTLRTIGLFAQQYAAATQTGFVQGVKTATGKQLNDQIDVWVGSIGRRAAKKAAYLDTMAQWHLTAKAKYKDRAQLSFYLRSLAFDHTRDGGEKLHAVPYATIEKFDPLHRQTFLFPHVMDPSQDDAVNPLGEALKDYLHGQPASNPDRSTNADASFYEWLEYHPFCIGTPVVTATANAYKNQINRVSYAGLDLGFVYVQAGQMTYERVLTDGGTTYMLNTTDFPRSSKGDPGAVAFVWDADQNLWLHEHGAEGFVHASAKQGRKIRCSGMMNAVNGKLTRVTNQSGHYQPTAENIFHFADWLNRRGCLAPNSDVRIMENEAVVKKGLYKMDAFLNYFDASGKTRAVPLPYPTAKPAHIP
ncbi:hypothetical protein [Muricoccus radiodurans]|uniref:hypothetical protein n=1 Tax=Muricoccus radiodurans TaxID=2231721 RepID=UPI003CE8E777